MDLQQPDHGTVTGLATLVFRVAVAAAAVAANAAGPGKRLLRAHLASVAAAYTD